jgi:hypothetical protein
MICAEILKSLNLNDGKEHIYHTAGKAAFENKDFMQQDFIPVKVKKQPEWKRTRYHNLVRLGGDIIKTGLAEYTKATILGALIYYAKKSKGALIDQ